MAAHLGAAVHSGHALQHSRQSRRGEAAEVRQLFGDLAADKTKQPCARRMAFPCMKHICYKPGHRCLHVALPALGVLVCSRVVTGQCQGAERVCRGLVPKLPTQQHGDVLAVVEPSGPSEPDSRRKQSKCQIKMAVSKVASRRAKLAGSMWRARCSPARLLQQTPPRPCPAAVADPQGRSVTMACRGGPRAAASCELLALGSPAHRRQGPSRKSETEALTLEAALA